MLPVFGSIKGGNSLIQSFLRRKRAITPIIVNPLITTNAYTKYSKNTSNVTPVVVIV